MRGWGLACHMPFFILPSLSASKLINELHIWKYSLTGGHNFFFNFSRSHCHYDAPYSPSFTFILTRICCVFEKFEVVARKSVCRSKWQDAARKTTRYKKINSQVKSRFLTRASHLSIRDSIEKCMERPVSIFSEQKN